MNAIQTLLRQEARPEAVTASCEHRAVSADGRILCRKIVAGDNEVSPDLCRSCPYRAVNCAHLRFGLRQTEPHRLIVRCNGRLEIWDDDPPQVCFEQAACAARVLPIQHARQCAGCVLRQPVRPRSEPAASCGVVGPRREVPKEALLRATAAAG